MSPCSGNMRLMSDINLITSRGDGNLTYLLVWTLTQNRYKPNYLERGRKHGRHFHKPILSIDINLITSRGDGNSNKPDSLLIVSMI